MTFDSKTLSSYPDKPGVYLMKGNDERVLYIGKANNLRARLRQYFAEKSGDEREMIPYLISEVKKIDTIVVLNEKDALLLENNLIKKHQPKYNVLLKDDKTFISLILTRHEWPMLKVVRGQKKPKEAESYFGPYTNAKAARQTYDLILKLFPLRQCSDGELARRTRPCLLYDIKKCVAPCVQKCTKEEYQTLVASAKKLLQGKDKETIAELQKKMEEAAEKLEFEKADEILRMMRNIEHVMTVQHVDNPEAKDCDVLGIHREGSAVLIAKLIFREGKLLGSEHFSFHQILPMDSEILESFLLQHYAKKELIPHEILVPIALPNANLVEDILLETAKKKAAVLFPQKGKKKELLGMAYQNASALFQREQDARSLREKMLLDLQEILQLNRYPRRIECIDTSHISGTDQVAALVVFVNGEKDKKEQRYFKIRGSAGDDYAAIKETLQRHFTKAKEKNVFCDLLIVDGGKGHLNAALEVFQELNVANVDVIGVSKFEASHTKGLTQEKVFLPHQKEPLLINPHSPLLFLLQKIRDEAHRVAISFHRQRRTKRTISTEIDEIEGIGPVKRKILLQHFGSVKRLKEASEEDFKKVKGLTKKDIQVLLQFIHRKS